MSELFAKDINKRAEPRFKVIGSIVVLAALYVLLQATPVAPFPHGADAFARGFALGMAIVAGIAWGTMRQSRSSRQPPNDRSS